MGLFDNLFRRQVRIIGGITPTIVGNTVSYIGENLENYIKEGYSLNDTIYSICQITSEKIKVAPWGAYKIVDERSLKRMQALQIENKAENHKKILDLRTKAIEPFKDSKLDDLLQWPNENETFSDLVAHSSISKMLTGNRYIRAILLDGGGNQGKPQELYLLPSQYMNIVRSNVYPVRATGFELNAGERIPFTLEEVLHDKYYNPNYDHQGGSHLYGLAPLKAALRLLTNDNSATEASTKSFQNMGPAGVMYMDDERMTGDQALEQAGAVKKKFIEEYSGSANAKKIVVSGYKVGWQAMGITPVDLAIIEQQKWNLTKFCNIWNFPHLMLSSENATDNNVGWAERALTQRCALPLMTSFRDNFNRQLQQNWGYKGQNIYIDYDQSVYSELDVNRKEATDWISKSYWLSERQKYELQNIDIPDYLDEEFLNSVHIPQGLVNAADMNINLDEEL